jgi:pimeloyl-ACP methyl ester carboxylesterase
VPLSTLSKEYEGRLHTFYSGGLKLAARIRGDFDKNHAVVFVSDIPHISNTVDELSLNFDSLSTAVIFPDLRGTGKSERFKNPFSYDMNFLIDDIENLRASLNLQKITFIGHGFGALLATKYSNLFPDRVEKLVLLSPTFSYDKSGKFSAAALAEKYRSKDSTAVQSTQFFDMYGYSIDDEVGFFGIAKIRAFLEIEKLWYADTLNAEKLLAKNIEGKIYSENDILNIHSQLLPIGLLYSAYKADFSQDFLNISVPAQALFGENDVFSGNKMKELFVKKFPRISSYSIKNSGYYIHLESTEFYSFLK